MTLPVNTLILGLKPSRPPLSAGTQRPAKLVAPSSSASRVLGTCFFSFPVDTGESALRLMGLPVLRACGRCLPAAPRMSLQEPDPTRDACSHPGRGCGRGCRAGWKPP